MPDLSYWLNATNNALPNWLKSKEKKTSEDGELDQYTLVYSIAKVMKTISDEIKQEVDSLYLANMTGTLLDFVGESRRVFRDLDENDNSYRERIRRFWSGPTSDYLEKSLNKNFGNYGKFTIFEVPYVFFSLDDKNYGGYLNDNSMLLETDLAISNITFPTASRIWNNAIIIYLDTNNPPSTTVINNQIFPLIQKLKVFGVIPYLVMFEP